MSQITLPLDIKSLEVFSQRIDTEGNIVFEVKSNNKLRSQTHIGFFEIILFLKKLTAGPLSVNLPQ